MMFDPLDYCEFCQRLDGSHSATCLLDSLARDLDLRPVVEFRPLAVLDLTDFGARAEAPGGEWPDFFAEA